MDAILKRRSVRTFDLTKKVSYEELLRLCEYGAAAPTARNQKSCSFVVIDDEAVIQELAKVSKGAMVLSKCNTAIAVIGLDPESLSTPLMQSQDLACTVENILIAATSKGIGSCYIGIYPLEERMKACDSILGVQDGAFTFALIAIGYPESSEVFFDKKKFDLTSVHHNRY